MNDGLDIGSCRGVPISKEEIINRVVAKENVNVVDSSNTAFSIERYKEYYVKIYPLYSVEFANRWFSYQGRIWYPLNYDSIWIDRHTIKLTDLGSILLS